MSDRPEGLMDPAAYRHAIRREADALLAALRDGDETATVPSCPEWSVRDLVVHLGKVHLWAGVNAESEPDGRAAQQQPGPADDEDLATWYAGTVERLLRTLDATDPDTPCWTFQPANRATRFWFRRQAQELAMHRVDIDLALGTPARYEPELASDGIAEVLDIFLQRRTHYGIPPLGLTAPLLIEATDRPERWLVEPIPGTDNVEHHGRGPQLTDAEAGTATAVLRGTAAGLLLTLWKRQDAESAGLELAGDVELATWLVKEKLTP